VSIWPWLVRRNLEGGEWRCRNEKGNEMQYLLGLIGDESETHNWEEI
jgi:hypothetical protein